MKIKKLLAGALASAMVLAAGSAALADSNEATSSGSTAQSVVTLTAAAASFQVTVPTTMAFSVAADGTVTAPTGLSIENGSNGQVAVTGVTVDADCGWAIDAYGTDYQEVAVNSQRMTLSLNGDNAPATASGSQGALTMTPASWPTIDGNGELAITAAADFAEQGTAIASATNVCHVIYTVGWYTGA